jgi:sugar phosphate isomerase/epimerase
MILKHGLHLAYCTNIHRGETWEDTFAALKKHTLEVKRRVAARRPYAIGLRLGSAAVQSLRERKTREDFRRWMDQEDCYVFTINGFPYGQFHGTRVKEQVYRPEWHEAARLEYTLALFEILAEILPAGIPGSVSTLPCSFKSFAPDTTQQERMRAHFRTCATQLARLSDRCGHDLHLGIEPEPLCWLETSEETCEFIRSLGRGEEIKRCIGVNYDTCHLAVEYESPEEALGNFASAEIRLSKLHLSSALKLVPHEENLHHLAQFDEPTYLHQTIVRHEDGQLERFTDLPDALATAKAQKGLYGTEWRVHFHVPLHGNADGDLQDTRDHLSGVLDALAKNPSACAHLEMETYTWGVLPEERRSADVCDQLECEYAWCLQELAQRGLA